MTDRRRHSAEKASHAGAMGPEKAAARLYLVTPLLGDAGAIANDLAHALNATEIAAVLVRLADGSETELTERVEALRILVQSNGAALLLEGRAELVAPTQADGAHLADIDALKSASSALKPKYIAGCGGLTTRHDAMIAGESGADYVMFGEPDREGRRPRFDAVLERVAWWAEVLTIPCVGYAGTLDEVEALARSGADFVAIGDDLWRNAATFAAVTQRLVVPEPVP